MVIQRIYVHPPSAKPLPSTVAQSAPTTLRKRSETLEAPEGKASSRPASPSEQGGTQNPPSQSKVAALRVQHTGGSFSEKSEQGTSRPTSPSPSPSPFETIRPSNASVLKPSDFAKRKSMFMQTTPTEPVKQFHAKLERHYSGVRKRSIDTSESEGTVKADSPPGTLRSRSASEGPAALTIQLRKTPKPFGEIQASPLSISPSSALPTTTPTTPAPAISELPTVAEASPLSTPSKAENRVMALAAKLREAASENNQLVSNISNLEQAVEKLKDQHREAQGAAAEIYQVLEEQAIPKAEFDVLKADTEKKQKDLEELALKTREGEKTLQELLDRTALMKAKTVEKGAVTPVRKEMGEREALEQAVERLKEQVDVVTGVTRDRRMSLSSQTSERTAPSATRVPLARARRGPPSSNASAIDVSAANSMEPVSPGLPSPMSPTMSSPPGSRSRRAQIVSFCEPVSLPGRAELERQLTAFYEETKKTTPVPQTPITSTHPKEEIGDVLAMLDGITDDGFNASVLSLDFPKTPLSPKSTTKGRDSMSTTGKGRDSMSMRSGSVRSKKKGWSSLFKVKLPGSSVKEDPSLRADGPPTLAPIAQPSPITL